MKFNYRAVTKKERIKKTLLLGIPASILIGIIGAFVIYIAISVGFNILYYLAVLGIGYIVGSMVKKIGRGTTSEFLLIAGLLSGLSVLIAMFTFINIFMFPISITGFFSYILTFEISRYFSIIEVIFAVAVGVYSANTVQMR